ncbi:MAG: hypothetical protein K9G38_05405 [Bacteroidales bacterium]|nr:hypothetical protein [Bacteroidales bacterium]
MAKQKGYIFSLTSSRLAPFVSLAVFAVAMLVVGVLQHNYYSRTYGEKDLHEFRDILHSREKAARNLFSRFSETFLEEEPLKVLQEASEELVRWAAEEDLSVFYYEEGKLKFWSDHSIPLQYRWTSRYRSPVLKTMNGTYVLVHQPVDKGMLLGMILIRKSYPYENSYLINAYQKDFRISPEVDLKMEPGPGLADVENLEGQYLFSLDLESALKHNSQNVDLSMVLFMVAIVALYIFLLLKTDAAQSGARRTRWFTISTLVMVGVSVSVIYFEIPRIVFDAGFFEPEIYASLNFPSLGHLWVFITLVLMISLLFYWFFNRSRTIPAALKLPVSFLLLALASFWFVFAHHKGESLVMDSSISFEAYKLSSVSIYTFAGLFVMLMSYVVFALLFDKALSISGKPRKPGMFVIMLLIIIAVQLPFLFIDSMQISVTTLAFFVAIASYLAYMRYGFKQLKFSHFFLLIMLFSAYITYDLQKHTSQKVRSQKEIELAKLSSEHDAVAEMLFPDLSDQLRTDSMLISRLSYQLIDANLVYEYLQRVYFSGYWTKYDLQITLCRPDDNVFIEPPVSAWYHCYSFFDELIMDEGIAVEGSDFYFLDNLEGRISYAGAIPYILRNDTVSLFLELNSKIISEELGYPSLLLREEREQGNSFSYARYNNGKLITNGGDYPYRLTPDYYTSFEETFEKVRIDQYDHSIFNMDEENTLIVSVPVVQFVDVLISFSYIFAFFFVIFVVNYLLVFASHLMATVTWDFKNKIQYSMIGILFFTFLVICSGTIYFVIQQYRVKHHDNLQNTIRSLYIELVHKVEFEEDLRNWSSDSYYDLDQLLRKFSNVFYTDINLFDEDGMLLATSRNEIFEQELLSTRMNRQAYEKLSDEDNSIFIHTESIGRMDYQSAYIPLLNSENNFLAYLNLPYFTQPELLTQEVTNLVVAILNIYMILLLVILFMSVFLADRITQPLRFIQSRIAQVSLSRNNEKIIYDGKDEIAGLVEEYNYMVDELEKSAELLAQSERESAWREMAKQIAHEIKNPLTPMKLNVQHMQRMIKEDGENIAERVEKVSQTLIEQIDSLTSIANEFSDFAKMPKARKRKINLAKKLQNVVNLFENSEGFRIELELGGLKEVWSYGDPEQFQRLIINLVKNGIQAVPDNREKKIAITMEKRSDMSVLITISDNGKGIPESIQDRLFRPNFTTKSAGMGMGLAISANIVKSMDGEIWYKTVPDKGTLFFVKIPVLK